MANQYKLWSKKEIIESIKEYYELCKKLPSTTDFKNENNLPSLVYTYKILNCNSIDEIIKLCDIKINTFDKKQYAISQLKHYYNLLKRIPTRTDFKINNWKPFYDFYAKNFGSYNNACVIAKLIDTPLSDEERINISIETLILLAKTKNRCPTVAEYDAIEQKGYCRRVLENKLKLKYNNICKKYISEYNLNINRDVTKDELINILIDIKNKLGRVPMFYEIKKYTNHTYKVFQRIFNMSYNQIIESLGWNPLGTTTIIRDKEILLNDFYMIFKKIKRIPTVLDLENEESIASYPTYIKYFKSIKNVCDILNIDYELYYKNYGAGKICFDNNGGICKSLIEKYITNYFINNNIIYEKETKYSKIINNINKRFDWNIQIGKNTYYIEYFGMYNSKPRGYIGKKYFERTKYKIKILYKHGYINNCIFIFPNDIKNKSLDEIFKPYLNIEKLN